MKYRRVFQIMAFSAIAGIQFGGAHAEITAHEPLPYQPYPTTLPVPQRAAPKANRLIQDPERFSSSLPASELPSSGNQLCETGILQKEQVKELVLAEAKRQNVDAALALAIAAEESDYGSNINSSAGARGIMQLMPATAAAYGVSSICDPEQNVAGGIRFLKDLTTRFDGNIMLVAAAYNAGEAKILKTRGIPSFPETVNYTAKVINRYYDFDNFLNKPNAKAPKRKAQTAKQSSTLTANSSEPKKQQWIGGSVLILN